MTDHTQNIPDMLATVLQQLPGSYLVGGCVRDILCGYTPKDYDVEVFGLTYEELHSKLLQFGKADLVGKSFGVIKLSIDEEIFDFAIPRQEIQTGTGHKGFSVQTDGSLSMQKAALQGFHDQLHVHGSTDRRNPRLFQRKS